MKYDKTLKQILSGKMRLEYFCELKYLKLRKLKDKVKNIKCNNVK